MLLLVDIYSIVVEQRKWRLSQFEHEQIIEHSKRNIRQVGNMRHTTLVEAHVRAILIRSEINCAITLSF